MKTQTILKAGAALGVAATLPLICVAPGPSKPEDRAPFYGRNFAHRGLHTEDGSVPENSMEAFRMAAEAGYGIELDVRLTRDGVLVVFHDDTLQRLCGVNCRVDELTFDELQGLRLCGTEQKVPRFSDVLTLIDGRVPLIVELKEGAHNREVCEKTLNQLNTYKGDACVESFHPVMVAYFRLHAPWLLRGQLATQTDDYDPEKVPAIGRMVLSHTLLNFVSRPQFIAYRIGERPLLVRLSEKLGAMCVGWTAHSEDAEEGRDAVIFEYYRPKPCFRHATWGDG